MTITRIKLPFGELDGRMMRVDEVARGKLCGCSCPECHRPLIAAKGDVVKHHFKHARDDNICHITPETVIHKYAKQVILEHASQLRFPDERSKKLLGRVVNITAEYRGLGDIIPDVFIEHARGNVAVEIFVTSKKSDDHVKAYNERRLAAMEIDCSGYEPDDEANWDWFICNEAVREWLSPPEHIRREREEAAVEKRRIEAERLAAEERYRIRQLFEENRRREEAEERARRQQEEAKERIRRQEEADAEAGRKIEAARREELARATAAVERDRRRQDKIEIAAAFEAEREQRAYEQWGSFWRWPRNIER
jgi:hypothetical protein